MFDEEFYDNEQAQVIARCEECGNLIYDDSGDMYMDNEGNYDRVKKALNRSNNLD